MKILKYQNMINNNIFQIKIFKKTIKKLIKLNFY